MAEENAETNTEPIAEDMDLLSNSKRARDEEDLEDAQNDAASKKPKVDEPSQVNLGPKSFESSVEMFDYFYKFLHYWPPNLNLNKYEHLVLLALLKKGHAEPDTKIGVGIRAFQVRYHPMFKSRCFFLVRDDDSSDDFSFRKCVDRILPLPDNMKVKSDANKALGGGRGRGGRGGGRGGYRGGKSRN